MVPDFYVGCPGWNPDDVVVAVPGGVEDAALLHAGGVVAAADAAPIFKRLFILIYLYIKQFPILKGK